MTVAAPRTPDTGIEAVLAGASNTPVAKPSGSAIASATQAPLFPEVLGQMVDSEIGNQPSSPRGAATGSKVTTAASAGASRKSAAERNRAASAAATAQPGQTALVPDPATTRPQYPWPPHGVALSLAASDGTLSETCDTGGDGAEGKASATPVGADSGATSIPVQASQPAGTPQAAARIGRIFAENSSPSAGGEQPTNLVTEAAGGPAIQPTEVALGIGPNATAAAQQVSGLPVPQTVEGAIRSAPEGTGERAARREPAAAVSSSQIPASSPANAAAAVPDERMSGAGSKPAAPTQNVAETRSAEPPAAEPAVAAYAVAAKGMDAATTILAARLVAPSRGRSFGPDRLASDSSDATTSDTVGSPEGDNHAEPGTLAFQAWLVPAPAPDPQPAGQEPRGAGDAATGQRRALEASGGWNGGRTGSRSIREADPGFAGAEPVAHSVSMVAPVPSNTAAGAGVAPLGTNPHHAASHAPADLSAWDAAASAPKPAAGGAAREIQLELRDADARVNVRLVERAGSVQVDVRTQDSHLAGALRDDLPALTARLEQTGLRTETWHDAPAAARIRTAEPAASADFQSSENQSRREGGGRDPRDGQPQEKRQNQNQPQSKEFSWLYTSLQ